MKFETRMAIIRRELIELLSRFSAPRGMTEEGQGQMIESIADALNRKLPVGNEDQFRENLHLTFAAVLDGHESYAWPPQAAFVKCVSRKGAASAKAQETFQSPKHDAMFARRMSQGEPVPERYIWGRDAARLTSSGAVTRQTLDLYRDGSVRAFVDAYRGDAAAVMVERYGDVVMPYFRDSAA